MRKFFKNNKRYFLFFIAYLTIFMVISTMIVVFLTRPEGKVKIPMLRGERFVEVYNSLIRKGLKPVIKFYDTTDKVSGEIIDQYPKAGVIRDKGTRLKLVISRNNVKVKVPVVKGSELSIAKNKLKNLHVGDETISLGVGVISYIPSNEVADNIVISQNPVAGEKISPEQTVNLLVSSGKIEDDMRMPAVTGQSIDLAYDLLLSKGVRVYQKIVQVGPKRSGKIISQKPYGRSRIKKGEQVNLTIGLYKTDKHFYSGYERFAYVIPESEKDGLYEAFIEDSNSRRIRFSRVMKPGKKIEFVFYRVGNAKITILRDKKQIKVDTIKVEDFM